MDWVGSGATRIRKSFRTEPEALAWEAFQEATRGAQKAALPVLAPVPAAPLTWADVLGRWASHAVPLVTVHQVAGDAPWCGERWTNRDGSPLKYVFGNPVNDTGHHLALGIVTKTPEVFAAFALYAFSQDDGPYRARREPIELREVVQSAVHRHDSRTGDYWRGNAAHVLPQVGDAPHHSADPVDWQGWVDAAAAKWQKLAANLAVRRWSNEYELRTRVNLTASPCG